MAGAVTTALPARDTLPHTTVPTEHAYTTGFALGGGVALPAAVAALVFHALTRDQG
ncbi:hypothetical protein AB0L06_23005 [Spirillospora sp. NPDC052269]